MRIINSYEKISAGLSMDFSKGINSMSEAISVSGSSAKEAGLSLEEYQSIIGKIVETTRVEGSQAGNAMKTILARVSRSKTGEDGEEVSSEERSTIAKAYKEVANIDLYDANGEFQDFGKTLDQLSEKWSTLSDSQKNYIAEQSAGVRNINTFKVLMDTWKDAKSLANDALTDTDFAAENQQKYLDSMQAKLNTLKASLQDFWNSFLDTGMLNAGIEALTLLTKGLEGLINLFKGIGDILPVINGEFTTLVGTITTVALAYKTFENIKKADSIKDGLKNTGTDIVSLFKSIGAYKDQFTEGFNTAKSAGSGFFSSILSGAKNTLGVMTTMQKAVLGFGAAFAAIYVGVKVFDALTDSSEETAEAVKKLNDEYQKSQETAKNAKSTIDSIGSEFETLSKGVSPLGENISLTTSEFERYHEICNKLADIFPNLVTGYDSQGNAILSLKGNVSELNDEYDKLLLKQAQDNYKEIGTYEENFRNLTGNRSWGTEAWDTVTDWGYADIGGRTTAKEVYDELKKIKGMDYDELKKYIQEGYQNRSDELSWMMDPENLGLDPNMTEEEFKALGDKITAAMNTVEAQINDGADSLKSAMQSYLQILSSKDDYKDVSDNVLSQVSLLISKTTSDQLEQLEKDGVTYEQYVENILNTLSKNKDASVSLKRLLSIDENTSIEDMKSIIEKDLDTLSKALKYDDKAELKVKLGLEDESELISKYDKSIKKISNRIKKEDILNDLFNTMDSDSNAAMYYKTLERYYKKQATISKKDDKSKVKKDDISSYQKTSKDGSRTVVLTPILPDGEVLSQESLEKYANDLLEGKSIKPDIVLNTFEGKDSAKQAEKFRKSIDKASNKYKDLKNYSDKVNSFIKEQNINTADELSLLQQCVNETDSWNEAMEKYITKSVDVEVGQEELEKLEKNLEIVEKNIDNVNEAIDASNTSMGLSKEQIDNVVSAFSDLDDFDYDTLFESTAEGVHLNVTEVEKLNKAYENMQSKKYSDEIDTLRDRYARLCVQIQETSDPLQKNQLIMEKTDLQKQIDQAQELQSRYEGLTNAVTKWQKAKAGSEAGDTYDEITQGFEDAQKLFENHQVGTREFKSFTQMLTNEDLSGKDPSYYAEVYADRMSKVKKYFTESDKGAYQFFVDLDKINDAFVDIDKNGNLKNINIDIAEASKELGVSEALVTEIFKKAGDFGAVLTFKEESEDLKTFRKAAEEANDVLKDIADNAKIDIAVDNKDEIQNQIKKGKDLISNLEKQKKQLEDTGDTGSDTYKKVCNQIDAANTQVKYLTAKLGDMASEQYVIDIHSDDGIDKLNESLKTFNKLKNLNIEIDWDNADATYYNNKVKELTKTVETLDKTDGKIDMSVDGAQEAMQLMYALIQKKREASKDVVLDIDTSQLEGSIKQGVEDLQELKNAINTLKDQKQMASLGFNVDTSAAEQAVVDARNNIIKNSPDIVQKLKIQGIDLDKATTAEEIQTALSSVNAKVMVKCGVDSTLVDGYVAEEKKGKGTVTWDNDETKVKAYADTKKTAQGTVYWGNYTDNVKKSFSATGTVNWKNASGPHDVNGNVNFRGSSFAGGTVGAPKDEVALVGEEAPELWVDRDTGKWQLIGQNGAEFRKIGKGDLIFSSEQTRMLLKNGKINSRGTSFLNGTIGKLNSLFKVDHGSAYAGGTQLGGWNRGSIHSNVKKTTSSKKSNSSNNNSNNTKDDYEEQFDYIELWIDRIERDIQNLDTVANSVYKSWTKRNQTLGQEFSKVTEEINRQQSAYQTYMNYANQVSLSESYKSKIRNGTLQIETIRDENLMDKINEYQEL